MHTQINLPPNFEKITESKLIYVIKHRKILG